VKMKIKGIKHVNLCCECSFHCNCIDDWDTEFEEE